MEKEMGKGQPHRIAITGPESTGKTVLCRQLAAYFHEPWVPEYSREYLNSLSGKREYGYDDILAIARGQYNRETAMLQQANEMLFCDTDFMVTHIWGLVKYGKSHEWIRRMAKEKPYDYTLLCDIDLPWEYDPLRENPGDRSPLFHIYVEQLTLYKIPFSIVSGTGEERLRNAVQHLYRQGIGKVTG